MHVTYQHPTCRQQRKSHDMSPEPVHASFRLESIGAIEQQLHPTPITSNTNDKARTRRKLVCMIALQQISKYTTTLPKYNKAANCTAYLGGKCLAWQNVCYRIRPCAVLAVRPVPRYLRDVRDKPICTEAALHKRGKNLSERPEERLHPL